MPFEIPAVFPDVKHEAPGTAPQGVVRLHIRCFEGTCSAGGMVVKVFDTTNGTLIAQGDVQCTGSRKLHELAVTVPRPLRATPVSIVFSCGAEQAEAFIGRLWIANVGPSVATPAHAAGAGRSAAKSPSAKSAAKKAGARRSRGAAAAPKAMVGAVDEPDDLTPKTTRPSADERREPEPEMTLAKRTGKTLDAVPDRVDERDWPFRPRLFALPDHVVNCGDVDTILDQGQEGACTGFALAAVINYLLRQRQVDRCVSPFMLYAMARRYDEWPGEGYEGSSARGAMMGWVRHGACTEKEWDKISYGVERLRAGVANGLTVAEAARQTPGGAFYRVQHDSVRDMHAAIAEVGMIYCTLMVHEGWASPGTEPNAPRAILPGAKGKGAIKSLPIIQRRGRAADGHAVALVGYTAEGFIVQNSWGRDWGERGFALLPYEDFMMHATDVWVMQVGVPVRIDLWEQGARFADTLSGIHRAHASIPLETVRPFVVDVGNNGQLSDTGDYWTTPDDIEHLFAKTIPEATKDWRRRRILLYLHGGLNDERGTAERIIAFKEVMLANEIYPVHIMWESGAMETVKSLLKDHLTDVDDRAGGPADWLKRLRDNLVEAKDRSLELTLAKPGSAMWREMKENARLASIHPDKKGAMELLTERARHAIGKLGAETRSTLELHMVGHSAGSIFAAYALPLILKTGIKLKTLQFMAPAIRLDLFKELVLPLVTSGKCPHPTNYILSDAGERDDTVGPYGKSLLFLVSNAFEGALGVPLLGMERFVSAKGETRDRFIHKDHKWTTSFFETKIDGSPSLIVAGNEELDKQFGVLQGANLSRSETHGGFDNDRDTMNSVLARVLGAKPRRAFEVRDLQY